MSIPSEDIDVPETVRMLARGATLTPVWRNGEGGLTFATDDGRFIKLIPRPTEISMAAEAGRMDWSRPFTAVRTCSTSAVTTSTSGS